MRDALYLLKTIKFYYNSEDQTGKSFPGFLSEFGGRIENNEYPIHALICELKEELGAEVNKEDVVSLGAITENAINQRDHPKVMDSVY